MMQDDAPHPAETDHVVAVHTGPAPAPPPPHSLEAERECLAACLCGSLVIEQLAKMLPVADLYVWRHQVLYAVMLEMHAEGIIVEPMALRLALVARGLYERVGEARTIGELAERAGTIDNVAHYAGIVVGQAKLRRLLDFARATEVAVMSGGDADDVVERTERGLVELLEGARPRAALQIQSLEQIGGADWLDTPPPKADALLTWGDGMRQPLLMAAGRVSLLAAAGGVGKTYALIQLAVAIATGTPWLARYQVSTKGRVLLALAEEDLDEVRRRLYMGAQVLGRAGDDDADYLRAEARRNLYPLALMGRDVAFVAVDRTATRWHSELVETLAKEGPWRALILDPLSRWGGPEIETDAHAATRVVQLLEQLTRLPGTPACIVAHHTNKGALRDDPAQRNQSIVRGHSALVDGARWVGYLERLTGRERSRSRLSVVKSNYGPVPPALELTRDGSGALRPMEPQELEAEREELEATRKSRKGFA